MAKKIENETPNLQDCELDIEAAEPTLQEVHSQQETATEEPGRTHHAAAFCDDLPTLRPLF